MNTGPHTSQRNSSQPAVGVRVPAALAFIVPSVALIILILLTPNLKLGIETIAGWLICLALFTLATAFDDRAQWTIWSSYGALAVLTGWLAFGLKEALLLIASGPLLGYLILRIRRPFSVNAPLITPAYLFDPVLTSLFPLLIAVLVHDLLGGVTPLSRIEPGEVIPLLAALVVQFIAAQMGRQILYTKIMRRPFTPIWRPEERARLYAGVILSPLVITLPLVLYANGVGVFIVIMLVVIALGIRSQQANEAAENSEALYQQSTELVRKLTLVNRASQNAMFNVEQTVAVKATCESAIAIVRADRAAVFLSERDSQVLKLSESIGFDAEQMLAGQEIPVGFALDELQIQVVHDIQKNGTSRALGAFNQRVPMKAFCEIPLRSGNLTLGILAVYHHQPHVHSPTELELLEILANQLAAALDNAYLLRTMEMHAFEMTHLVHLSRISTASLELNQVAYDVASVLRQMTLLDWVMIALLEDQNSARLTVAGLSSLWSVEESETVQYRLPEFPEIRLLRESSDAGLVQVHLNDAGISPTLANYMENNRLMSMALVPMITPQDVFGVILLGTERDHPFGDHEIQLIETAANQISTQIFNARLYISTHDALKQQLHQLALIEDVVQRISSSHDFNAIISDVFEAVVKSTRADVVHLALLTEADDFWVIEQFYEDGEIFRHCAQQGKNEGIIGRVGTTGEILLTPDNDAVPAYVGSPFAVYQSSLSVPLKKDGEVVGVLNVESKKPDYFIMSQADFLKNLGGHAIISIENARLMEELQYQIDKLTHLRELSVMLSAAVLTDSVARAVMQTAMAMMNCQYASMFQYESDFQELVPLEKIEADPSNGGMLAQSAELLALALEAAHSGQIQTLESAAPTDEHQPRAYPSIVAVPIAHSGAVHEILCLGFSEQQHFEERDLYTLTLLASQAAGHFENSTLNERIHDGNNRMRAILDSTRDGVILLDFGGRLIEVNPAAQRLLGINFSEHIGQSFVDALLRYIETDEDRQVGYSREELTKLARIERLQPRGITRREFSRRVQPNQTIFIEETGSPVLDENNHTVGRLLVLRDITEEKMVETYREEITSMAVHDLRSPLSAVINALRIALENIDSPAGLPVAKQTINLGLGSADRMMNLVNSLLDIRKGKQMSLECAPIAIEELIELARLTLASTAEKINVPIEVVTPAYLPAVNVDADKMRRVIINLLDNALRYTPSGKPVQISVSTIPGKHKLLLRVADSGPGIPEKDRERIFEQYWQVSENKPLRGTKGSGIGLTFCHRVMEAHGEKIWVDDSCPLPGACFALTLPLA